MGWALRQADPDRAWAGRWCRPRASCLKYAFGCSRHSRGHVLAPSYRLGLGIETALQEIEEEQGRNLTPQSHKRVCDCLRMASAFTAGQVAIALRYLFEG